MAIVRWRKPELSDPWDEFRRLQDEINNLFNYDRFPATEGLFDRTFSPPIDVIEGAEEFTVLCELPGVSSKNLDISITSNVLTIKGEKSREEKKDTVKVFRRELWKGNFQRTISLPSSVDGTKEIRAELKEGILKLLLPKREETKPRQISIQAR